MSSPTQLRPPRVAVLLATFNGRRWLDEQIVSILGQTGVTARIIALDDGSTDGTLERLTETAQRDARVTVLPTRGASGSAAANFLRLLLAAELAEDELVAFADQDDVWRPRKLERHARILTEHDIDGVSSNVTAFTGNGTRSLIRKDYPQRRFDFLLESAGPGSTFLLSPRLTQLARTTLANDNTLARGDTPHDWLVYAIARGHGWRWHIDAEPTVDYRQHDANVLGANVGVKPAQQRLRAMRNGSHRASAITAARAALAVATPELRPDLETFADLFAKRDLRSRWALAARAGELRRRPRDRAVIRTAIATGLW